MASDTRVAFDIGGTFTDIIFSSSDGHFLTYKIPSFLATIGEDVGKCIVESLAEIGEDRLTEIVHGSTIAANTMLEAKGAVTGFLTTTGFRDELEIRGLARTTQSSFFLWERLAPLIPRRLRREIGGRINAHGEIERPLDVDAARAAIQLLIDYGAESIAICLINSYVNPVHEQQVAELVREMLPHTSLSVSHEVLPKIRESDRGSTTAINAYLMPVVAKYLGSLESQLEKFAPSLKIMQSSGGVMTLAHAKERPIHMIESGPAAGVLAAAALAREAGLQKAVAFDMGGTTVKACLIENFKPVEKTESEVGGHANIGARYAKGSGYALSVPVLDIVEAGAGGGSIAWIDDSSALRVGPTSANALPGPVCYGRGGRAVTVTDANVVLGYMNPNAIAGGSVPIDREAAIGVIEHELCARLGLSVMDAAHGIHQVANVAMRRAIRAVTTERGHDPREFTLIAFGGAGPIHAAELARTLGITRVYVPLHPGLFSALGLLFADLRFDYVQSDPSELDQLDGAELIEKFRSFEADAHEKLRKEDLRPEAVTLRKLVDLRYAGQVSELAVDFPDRTPAAEMRAALAESFHAAHERAYGYRRPGETIAIANYRLIAHASLRSIRFADLSKSAFARIKDVDQNDSVRTAYFGSEFGHLETRIVSRARLQDGAIAGPVIVEEFDTTIVVPPNWSAVLDHYGNVVLELGKFTRDAQP